MTLNIMLATIAIIISIANIVAVIIKIKQDNQYDQYLKEENEKHN